MRAHLAEHVWCCLSAFGHAPQLSPSTLDPPADPAPAPFSDPLQSLCNAPGLQGSLPSRDDWNTEPLGESVENPRVRIPHRGHNKYIAQPAASSTVGHTGEAWDLIKNAETDSVGLGRGCGGAGLHSSTSFQVRL